MCLLQLFLRVKEQLVRVIRHSVDSQPTLSITKKRGPRPSPIRGSGRQGNDLLFLSAEGEPVQAAYGRSELLA